MKQTINHQNPNFEQLPMQINVKIYRPSVKGPILADASVNLNGCFAIRGVQVKEAETAPSSPCPAARSKANIGTSVSPAPRNSNSPSTRPFWTPTGWSWIRDSTSTITRPRSKTAPRWTACRCDRKERKLI